MTRQGGHVTRVEINFFSARIQEKVKHRVEKSKNRSPKSHISAK